MSTDRSELDDLLAVVEDYADKALAESTEVDLSQIRSTPLPTLVSDLLEADMAQPLAWTFEAVEAVAKRSASWAFVLASRYAAQFVTRDVAVAPTDCFLAGGELTENGVLVPAAPLAAGPVESMVVVTDEGISFLEDAAITQTQPGRTGLAAARLTQVIARSGEPILARGGSPAWPVLVGAAVCGLGSALSHESIVYTEQREQFGAQIASFPDLRAVVGTANAEVRRARALLYAHALNEATTPENDALSTAADAVVSCAIDTVQSMGGYGYIDEFPVAGMLRDAVSLRARSASAVSGWRASAEVAYTSKGQV